MSKKRPRRTAKELKFKDAKRLDAIHELIEAEEWEDAEERLQNFVHVNSDVVEGWDMMMEMATAMGNSLLAWEATENLLELDPDEAVHYYNAALISAQLTMPFSALHYCEIYLQRFPIELQIKQMKELHDMAAPECKRLREEDEMAKQAPSDDDLMLFEQGQVQVTMGHYAEGRKLSLQAAERFPHSPAPLNNVSLSYAVEGKLEQALQTTQQVLAEHPNNLHARCNLVQYLIRLGRGAEVKPVLDRLRTETPDMQDHWDKLLDTFAYAGDDATVVEVYERAEKALKKEKLELSPIGQHFAAAGYARLGKVREAEKLWKAALKQAPGLEVARQNLDDLSLPIGERNGAWYHGFNYWVSQEWIKQLEIILKKNSRRSEQAFMRDMERLFQGNPALRAALPILLDRGDEIGREFVLNVGTSIPIEGLKEFALGERGSDEIRTEAAQILTERGELDSTLPVEMYVRGKREPVRMTSFEIHSETSDSGLPDEAQAHLDAGFAALQEKQPEKAMEHIESGLRLVPDERTFLNQKVAALSLLKRTKEAAEVVRHMAALYPDYLFARCAMAQLCAHERKFDEAHEWLKPLLTQSRFHYSEFRALAYAHIEVLTARGDKQGAASWRAMLEEYDLVD